MTKLRIYKGKTWQPPDVRDELCSILVGIEQATAGCHRFLFAEAEASLDFESSYEAQVVARWVFTTEFMRSLLEIISTICTLAFCPTQDRPTTQYSSTPFSAPIKSRFRLQLSGVFGRSYRFCVYEARSPLGRVLIILAAA